MFSCLNRSSSSSLSTSSTYLTYLSHLAYASAMLEDVIDGGGDIFGKSFFFLCLRERAFFRNEARKNFFNKICFYNTCVKK